MRGALSLYAAVAVGCVAPVSEKTQSIIGGSNAALDPAVAMLEIGVGTCTASLVRPNVLLTAAHCVDSGASIIAYIGGEAVAVVEVSVPRQYVSFEHHDVALVRLERELTVTPVAMNLGAVSVDLSRVRLVGFGADQPQSSGSGIGTKREVVAQVTSVTGEHVRFGDMSANICIGDSGGPAFAVIGGSELVVGVASTTTQGCLGTSAATRVDVYAKGFLEPVLSTWYGACAADGLCDSAEDCAFPDPDCDPCGFDGTCMEGCAAPDLDCPLGGLSGEVCADAGDCESRLCIADEVDARAMFCSSECSLDVACTAPLARCIGGQCRFEGPTPGTQGAPCIFDEQCESTLCDPDQGICVEPCETSADCTHGYECRGGDVCSAARTGSCSTTSGARVWPFLLIILTGLRRRRTGRVPSRGTFPCRARRRNRSLWPRRNR